jgi:integrase
VRAEGGASELVDLRWEQVDLENAILHVRRVKQGTPATHPLAAASYAHCGWAVEN